MKDQKNKEYSKEQAEFVEEEPEQRGLKIADTWLYKVFVKSAYLLINKPLAVFRLIKQVIAHIERYASVKELTKDVLEHLGTAMRLVRSYAKGEYRGISVKGIALTVAALLYFVAPLDFIPDFLLFGLVDDIALLMWVYKNYKDEFEKFLEWEDEKKMRIDLPDLPIGGEEKGDEV